MKIRGVQVYRKEAVRSQHQRMGNPVSAMSLDVEAIALIDTGSVISDTSGFTEKSAECKVWFKWAGGHKEDVDDAQVCNAYGDLIKFSMWLLWKLRSRGAGGTETQLYATFEGSADSSVSRLWQRC